MSQGTHRSSRARSSLKLRVPALPSGYWIPNTETASHIFGPSLPQQYEQLSSQAVEIKRMLTVLIQNALKAKLKADG